MALQQPILNPCVPFCSPIFGGLCEGKNILIQGCVIVSAKRFSVNLVCANGDIAFHFNPRFDEGNIIVCNTQEKGCWGPEERTSTMLFQRGVSFQVIINIRSCGYQVSINGSQFIDYRHRLPMNLVQTLQIKGDVSLSCINFTGGFNFGGMTVCNPATPFNAILSGRFFPFCKIKIMGSIPYSADRFHVNLKNLLLGNIALHVNPRFKEGALVRNSFINGAWGSEERNVAFLPFCPGQAFQLEITYLENCYQVLVNGQLKFEYVHRIPPSQVDQLEIDGDVILSCVQY
ncbi:galectin-4-like [Pseudonaja textilis]|uniref:galectin-4-like n=1 Tax=Pseudonaja textilis TaxID=8673 RepID=UPI000EA944F2|nr:galectin-4-like [Pseudonaja textilis]